MKFGFPNSIDVSAFSTQGDLSLCWKGNSLISRRRFFHYHIDVDVHDNKCGVTWKLMGFYGNPDERLRGASWDLLRRLANEHMGPWLVIGDFNEIASSFEKKGGRL